MAAGRKTCCFFTVFRTFSCVFIYIKRKKERYFMDKFMTYDGKQYLVVEAQVGDSIDEAFDRM